MSALARMVRQVIEPQSVLEGAGVRLNRSIGTQTLDHLDPFLLFDDFSSKHRLDYEAGFPLHPHRRKCVLRGLWVSNSGSICLPGSK
jgi:redox-sensitive bicupin YhaK (pirin superfamily)